MKLIIDTREKKLLPYFPDIETKNLDIGDIQFITDEKINLVIERKTQDDLSASIKDGRHREQKLRLLNSNIPVIIYIIEGNSNDNYISGIKSDTHISVILNTVFRDKLHVFRTLNIKETANLINKLFLKFKNNEFESKTVEYSSVIKVKKKSNLTPENCYIAQLSQIPGVSNTIAKCICNKYPTMSNLCDSYLKQNENQRKNLLEDLKIIQSTGKSRKVGKVVSERIYNYINGI
jgi:ERCC4-type nuclease